MSGNGDYKYYRNLFNRIKEQDAALYIFAELVNAVLTQKLWADGERLVLLKAINQAYRDSVA